MPPRIDYTHGRMRRRIVSTMLWLVGMCAAASAQEAGDVPGGEPGVAGAFAVTDEELEASLPSDEHQPVSNRTMALMLQRIYRSSDPMKNQFRSIEQVPFLRSAIGSEKSAEKRAELQYTLARQLLQGGSLEDALAEFGVLERLTQQAGAPLDARRAALLGTSKALCHFRLAEQQNCLLDHNADSCLLPIAQGGVHQLQDGSRAAIAELEAVLRRAPGDLRARWLLNIAAMTVGDYPDKVSPLWRLDPALFRSAYDIGRFPDVAGAAGLAVNDLAGGVVLEDFDGDELIDVMISAWGFTASNQMRLFRNNGDGTFTELTREAGLLGLVGGLNLLQGDYDNDGRPDVLVLRGGWLGTEGHFPLSLLRNDGDFRFTDVTEAAGLLRFHPTQAATWFDYDGDGRLDIFVANETTRRDVNPCELFHNEGDGTFRDLAAGSGVALTGYFKGVVSDDFNNDGRPDLYLSRRDGENLLLRNDGPGGAQGAVPGSWQFTDVAPALGVGAPRASFPCWFWDFDNNGWVDIAVTGYWIEDAGDVAADMLGLPHKAERARLYRNNGDGSFSDVTRQMGLDRVVHAMSANFGDLDNDGWLDFYTGTGDPDLATVIPNLMFRNDRGRRFQDVTTSGGFGQLQKGHGIAVADLDNDGDQDIYSCVGGAVETDFYPNQLFANPGHGRRWLKFRLEGVHTNRAAIGARVRVIVAEAGTERSIHRTVSSGASFGASTLRVEVGLGAATEVRRVEVFWPATGRTEVFEGIEADRAYRLREDSAAAEAIVLKAYHLPLTVDPARRSTYDGRDPMPREWCQPVPIR